MNDLYNDLPPSPSDMGPFRLGDWLVEPSLNRLSRGDKSVSIEPRIMHVLTCLASRPGEAVTRTDLLDIVWGEVIVNEEALTQAVSQLRRVVGDDPRSARYIETIPKTGYRLIMPVEPLSGPAGEAPSGADRASIDRPMPSRRRLAVALSSIAVAVAVIALLLIIPRSRSTGPPPPVALGEMPFTSYPGKEICPAISPDGTRIAFCWDGEEEDQYDLYIKQKNTEVPLRLTATEGNEYYPAWSPDGTELAYALAAEGDIDIYTIPAIGGPARKIVDVLHGIAALDWSPDGRRLAYSTRPNLESPLQIFLVSLDTGDTHALTTPMPLSRGDFRPVFSPDGESIAFVRGDRTALQDIFIMSTSGGEPRRITHSQHSVTGLEWMPDGEALVFSSGPTRVAHMRLWRISLRDGSLAWLPTTGYRPIRPSIAAKGKGLVYEEQSIGSNIFKINVDEEDTVVPIAASTRHDYGPQFSPGGRYISFISDRSGSPQIWVCRSDGCEPRQLTRFESAYIENPCWSHDERRVAFTAAPGTHSAIYIADVETGEVHRLRGSPEAKGGRHEKCLGWSRDGQWLYCKSERDEAWRVRKIRTDGTDIVDIMDKDVFRLAESTDGEHLVYSRADTSGVWTASLDGDDERCIIDEPGTVVPCGWRETGDKVFFFSAEGRAINLMVRDRATGAASRVASGASFFAINLDVSPLGDAVVFDRLEHLGSDLALVEGF
jgi:Tol biopolymer transport system component/DNA-binding winged helix-turn-helix (wHTH) protein